MYSATVTPSARRQSPPRGHTRSFTALSMILRACLRFTSMLDELRKPIPEGKRNQSLFRMGLEQAAHADDFETLMDVMRTRNMDCTLPLPESELESRRSFCLEV